MDRETLDLLVTARRERRPAVLITRLTAATQTLLYGDGGIHGVPLTAELTEVAMEALRLGRCRTLPLDGDELFFHPYTVPLRMVIVGAVHIAKPLSLLAGLCNYQVTIIDPRQAFASEARFPQTELITEWPEQALEDLQPDSRTAIVTLTHDPKLDDPALAAALRSDAFYIGALGSRKTQQGRQQRLAERGLTESQQSRIHGPVGLDIGAQSPEEIAVAIMAEVTRSLRKGSGDAV